MVLYRYERGNKSELFRLYTVSLEAFEVVKKTQKGFWIVDIWGKKRFVLNSENARKRFAYETKEQALNYFIAKTKKHIKILESRLFDAQGYLYAATETDSNNSEPEKYELDSFIDFPFIREILE